MCLHLLICIIFVSIGATMQILSNLMERLGRRRIIYDRDTNEPYLIRYYLFLKDRKKFPFNVVWHRILKSDDPVPHDHPFPFFTIILKGGYYETMPVLDEDGYCIDFTTQWKGPGSIIWHKASDYHYLTLRDNKPCTTLFFMGPQQTTWGFLTAKGWVEWFNYIK